MTMSTLGSMATGLNDLVQGHDLWYALGDAGFSAAGTVLGGAAGAAYCGPDPVDLVCAGVGAIIGGNVAPVVYHGVIDIFKRIF